MTLKFRAKAILASLLAGAVFASLAGCAVVSGSGSSGGATQPTPPASTTTIPVAPAGLQAAPGNAEVALTWTAATSATSYHVKRSTTSGGPYTQVSAPATSVFTDTGLTNGTMYFYVVSALNSAGESPNSAQASANTCSTSASAAGGARIARESHRNRRQRASRTDLDRQHRSH